MCRLFAFRSIEPVKPSDCLINSNNSMLNQSIKNQDGWGISYFSDGKSEVIKNIESAYVDKRFIRTSSEITSNTILSHIRNATQGKLDRYNTQPFKYKDWVFAHNGNLKNFPVIKKELISKIDKKLQKNIKGNTDSEVIFNILLSKMNKFPCKNIKYPLMNLV